MSELLEAEELIKIKSYIDRIIEGKYYNLLKEEKYKNYYKKYKKNFEKYKKEIIESQETNVRKIECKLLKFNISCYILYKNAKKCLKGLKNEK